MSPARASCEHSKSINSECGHDETCVPEREARQKTVYEIFDAYVIAAQTLLLVAVADHPGLQPFLGRRKGDFPCGSIMSHGQRINKYLTLI
jgi:hypothetical protein